MRVPIARHLERSRLRITLIRQPLTPMVTSVASLHNSCTSSDVIATLTGSGHNNNVATARVVSLSATTLLLSGYAELKFSSESAHGENDGC